MNSLPQQYISNNHSEITQIADLEKAMLIPYCLPIEENYLPDTSILKNLNNNYTGSNIYSQQQSKIGNIDPTISTYSPKIIVTKPRNFSGKSVKLTKKKENIEDHNLIKGIKKLREWILILKLPAIILTKAEELFLKAERNQNLKGRSLDILAATIIFITSRQCDWPLNPIEITKTTEIPMKYIRSCYKFIKQNITYDIPHIDPIKYGEDFSIKLGLPQKITNAIIETINRITRKGLIDGRNPRTIASAAIYMVSQLTNDLKITLKEISYVSNIAESTIKSSVRTLFIFRYEILPEWEGRMPLQCLSLI